MHEHVGPLWYSCVFAAACCCLCLNRNFWDGLLHYLYLQYLHDGGNILPLKQSTRGLSEGCMLDWKIISMFVWLVADGWCWFVLREKYCWLIGCGNVPHLMRRDIKAGDRSTRQGVVKLFGESPKWYLLSVSLFLVKLI
jgi:hypothetical protein